MPRALLLFLLALILGAAAWLLLSEPGDGRGGGAEGGTAADAEAAGDPDAGLYAGTAPVAPADPGTARVGRSSRPGAEPGDDERERGDEERVPIRVIDEDEEPVAGAAVHFLLVREGERQSWQDLREEEPDREKLLRERGRSLRTGEDGTVLVPVVEDFVAVSARKGQRYGERDVWKRQLSGDDEPVDVLLEEDHFLDVRVVDEQGSPVADFPVGFALLRPQWSHYVEQRDTDGEGLVRFHHVQRSFDMLNSNERHLAVLLAVPLDELVLHELDPRSLPEEPVELVAPPTGRVEVRLLDFRGRPVEKQVAVRLQRAGEEPPSWYDADDYWPRATHGDQRVTARDGVAVFPRVGVGIEVEAAAQLDASRSWFKTAGPGPRHAGAVASFEIRQDVLRPVIVLTVLRPDGTPLADADLRTELRFEGTASSRTHGGFEETDGKGIVRLAIQEESLAEYDLCSLRLWRQGEDEEPTLTGEIAVPTGIGGGEQDLGRLRLRVAPTIAAGVVVDAGGAPVAGARVWVEYEIRDGDRPGRSRWRRPHMMRVSPTDEDGRFAIHGELQEPVIRLRVQHQEYLSKTADAVRGSRDHRIVLDQGYRLEGRLLLDEDVPAQELELVLTDRRFEDAENRGEWRWSGSSERVEANGRFSFGALEADTGHLHLVQDDVAWPLATLADVQPWSPDAAPDPRLDPWDLRGVVRMVEVEVRNRRGEAPEQLRFASVADDATEADSWESVRGGRIALLLGGRTPDLLIHAPGYRVARVPRIRDDREVVLEDGIPVRLRLQPALALREGARLIAHLRHLDGGLHPRGGRELQFGEGDSLRVSLPQPGRYRVHLVAQWEAEDGNRRRHTLRAGDRRAHVIEVTDGIAEQSFTIQIPAEQLDALPR